MRQIHAAIEHLHRGDFECAITLAAAGEGMLPPTEEPYFRELAAKWRYEDIVNWLRHGEIKDIENGKKEQREAVTITELGTIAVIYRAIAKFDAVFGDEKTPQIISIRICAGRVCRTVDAARRSSRARPALTSGGMAVRHGNRAHGAPAVFAELVLGADHR